MLIRAIEDRIFRSAAPMAVRHLAKPDLNTKEPLTRNVLDQASREFQVAPPFTVHISDPELLAGVWCMAREAYLVNAGGRAVREAVAEAVSTLNDCPYCVAVHAGMYASVGEDARHLAEPTRLPPHIAPAHAWAAATLSPDADALRHPQVAASDVPQIFGTAVTFHYINRMASVFLGETPVALPGMASAPGRKLTHLSFEFFGRRIVKLDPRPGHCVGQPDEELPVEFQWASSNPAVANGLAHFAAAAEKAGQSAVPKAVRTFVLDQLDAWRGEQAPISRSWVDEAVGPIDDALRPAARLALLTARAAYQVDGSTIEAFRDITPGDKPLLQTVAWGAFAATRRIASWFPDPIGSNGKDHA